MHNRLEADAFVPCGGRPNTIDINNYMQFIKKDGTPSSPLIIEGVNLFVTAEARKKLYEEAGVHILSKIHQPIRAASLHPVMKFVSPCHKEAIVEEVLEKLRGMAKLEAELLFREAENFGGSLPEVSQIIRFGW